ncbi:MAG: glycoside hydrolase family 13 protein [Actinomycetota bacterium]|nr:glycoside hydrolase family 13 protein [Actinomycetota bacterium]
MPKRPWWQDAVCYEIYVRSFADADGDGVGDLAGITSRMPYLARLGVDAVWLTPFYPSPQVDHGYDVADYRDVHPLFGDLGDFDTLLAAAHQHRLRVVVDIVPNHTSSEHHWFRAALAAAPGSRERARYIFRPGRGRTGSRPPNRWRSRFGGPAWTRVADGEWYLHLFDAGQPDLNWENPEVGDEFEDILRFWLRRGVDGFRIDVAHGLVKAAGLPDVRRGAPLPQWDRPEVHDVYRRWRKVLDSYPGDRVAVAEAWVSGPEAMARYLRPDELQQAFNFHWLLAPWSAAAFRRVIVATLAATSPVGAAPTWVLSNHDVVRHVSRYGGGPRGLARAKAATLAMLALPGSAYLYAGEELGLPQVDVPEHARQDPVYRRGGRTGRDGCRVPIPWSGDTAPYGFGPPASAPTWLPQPACWGSLSVAAQEADPHSTLRFYRRALATRRRLAGGLGTGVTLLDTPPGVLAFRREPGLVCVLNCGHRRTPVGRYGEVVVASGHHEQVVEGWLPTDTCAWFSHGSGSRAS